MSLKEIFDHFKSEGQVILKTPFSFVTCVLIFGVIIFSAVEWHYVGTIEEKDADLGQKEATITTISAERDSVKGDNDRLSRDNVTLRNENEAYQSARADKSFPFKKRVQILADQISEWATEIETAKTNQNSTKLMVLQNEWGNRFEPRIEVYLKQLDELGQHSEKLEEMNGYPQVYSQTFSSDIKTLTEELNRLARELPNTDTP